MSLPFLDSKKIGAIISARQKPSGSVEMKMEQSSMDPEQHALMDEVMKAVKADDHQMLWDALEAAFQIMEMAPHMEFEGDE